MTLTEAIADAQKLKELTYCSTCVVHWTRENEYYAIMTESFLSTTISLQDQGISIHRRLITVFPGKITSCVHSVNDQEDAKNDVRDQQEATCR